MDNSKMVAVWLCCCCRHCFAWTADARHLCCCVKSSFQSCGKEMVKKQVLMNYFQPEQGGTSIFWTLHSIGIWRGGDVPLHIQLPEGELQLHPWWLNDCCAEHHLFACICTTGESADFFLAWKCYHFYLQTFSKSKKILPPRAGGSQRFSTKRNIYFRFPTHFPKINNFLSGRALCKKTSEKLEQMIHLTAQTHTSWHCWKTHTLLVISFSTTDILNFSLFSTAPAISLEQIISVVEQTTAGGWWMSVVKSLWEILKGSVLEDKAAYSDPELTAWCFCKILTKVKDRKRIILPKSPRGVTHDSPTQRT